MYIDFVVILSIYNQCTLIYNKTIQGRQTSRKPDRDEPSAGAVKHEPQDKIKEVKKNMKKYEITVDGYKVGVIDLTPEEVKALQSDKDIVIRAINN